MFNPVSLIFSGGGPINVVGVDAIFISALMGCLVCAAFRLSVVLLTKKSGDISPPPFILHPRASIRPANSEWPRNAVLPHSFPQGFEKGPSLPARFFNHMGVAVSNKSGVVFGAETPCFSDLIASLNGAKLHGFSPFQSLLILSQYARKGQA